jgi:hypothetical protein
MKTRIACVILLCLLPCLVSAGDSDGGRKKTLAKPQEMDKPTALLASGSGTLVYGDSAMVDRFDFAASPTTTCGTAVTGDNHVYEVIPFTSDANGNATLVYSGDCSNTSGLGSPVSYVSIHTGSFSAASKCTNFVWGMDGNTATPQTITVPASTSMVMVLSGYNSEIDINCDYTYTLNSTAAVPTMNQWALVGLCTLLVSGGVWAVRRRRTRANVEA